MRSERGPEIGSVAWKAFRTRVTENAEKAIFVNGETFYYIYYTPMTDTDKILQKLDEQGRKIDEQGRNIDEQGKRLTQLQSDVSIIKADVAKNELNIEAFRAEQRQANEDLVQLVIKTYDDTAEQSQALEKRVARIEKHPNLPPTR